ncbi:MAG TPA: bifunctional phosphoglucose/phosphomannose isomerase [Dehalococcoidia bacterium]
MDPLDRADEIRRLDPSGLLDRIRETPARLRDAWREACAFQPPPAYRDVRRVLVLGMGGSALGGDLVRALADREGTVPVSVHRGYGLPAWADARTLVLASSYSGATEETLSGLRAALAAGCPAVAVCTGGPMAALAAEHGVPLLRFAYDAPPRAAIAYSFACLLAVVTRLGLLPDPGDALADAAAAMEETAREVDAAVPATRNPAKALARRLQGRLPVVYGAEFLAPVAYRWRTQLNENAEVWAFSEELPEANHNSIVGYGRPAGLLPSLAAVFLRSPLLHPRVLARYDATAEELARAGVEHVTVEARGRGAMAHMLSALLLGDFVSYYLAALNGVDPAAMSPLVALKERLARQGPTG